MVLSLENDAKEKIETELSTFRDRLYYIFHEQRLNCEYLLGINTEEEEGVQCQNEEMFSSEYFSQDQCSYNLYQTQMNENGSDSSVRLCDADNTSDRSMTSADGIHGKEDRINEYILRMTTATMKMNFLLHNYQRLRKTSKKSN